MAQPLRRALTAHLESSDDEDEANNGLQRTSSDVSDVKTHGSNRASLLTKQLRDAASLPLASVSEAHADRGLAGDTADSQRHDVQLRSSNVTTGGPSPIHLHPRATLDPAALLAARSSTGTITTAAPSLTGETGSCASRGVDIVPPKRGALTGARDRSGPLALAPFGPGEGWEAEAAHRKCSSLPEHSNTKGGWVRWWVNWSLQCVATQRTGTFVLSLLLRFAFSTWCIGTVSSRGNGLFGLF